MHLQQTTFEHCHKMRNCSWWAIFTFVTMTSTLFNNCINFSFIDLRFSIFFANMFSKSFALCWKGILILNLMQSVSNVWRLLLGNLSQLLILHFILNVWASFVLVISVIYYKAIWVPKISFLISAPPAFLIHPKDQVVAKGRTVTLQCVAKGNPPPTVFWRKDEQEVSILLLMGV